MSALEIAWAISLIVFAGTLWPAVVRTLAYRSGEIDHTPTMRTVAIFAVSLAGTAFVCFVVLSVLLLV